MITTMFGLGAFFGAALGVSTAGRLFFGNQRGISTRATGSKQELHAELHLPHRPNDPGDPPGVEEIWATP